KNEARLPLRDRTADAVLRLLGGKSDTSPDEGDDAHDASTLEAAFGEEERSMVSGVLTLGERSIRSIMTPRSEISWVNLEEDSSDILAYLRKTPHSFFPVCRGDLDDVVGVARAKDLLAELMDGRKPNEKLSCLRTPIFVYETMGVLSAIDTLKS